MCASSRTRPGLTPVSARTAPRVISTSAAATPSPASPSTPTPSRSTLWLAALKPPMYAVALVPVCVGGAAAISAHTSLPWPLLTATLRTLALAAAGAASVIAWLNLSNDAWDAGTGVDAAKAESIVNLLRGRVLPVHLASLAALAAGISWLSSALAAAGCPVAWWKATMSSADPRPAALLTAAVTAGYLYQGPPFRLSYVGAGEPLCFAAFGPAAVTAFYLLGANCLRSVASALPPLLTPASAVSAFLVGLTTTSVLFCSHFHQVEGDRAAGKRSPLVRLGGDTGVAAGLLKQGVQLAYAVLALAAAAQALPLPAALSAVALSFAPARTLVARADADHAVPSRSRFLKLAALDWHGGLGAGLTLGLAGPAIFSSARAAGVLM